MKKIGLFLMVLLILPLEAKCLSCDLSTKSYEKKLAANINWSYEYYLEDNEMYFDVTFVNLIEDIYVLDTDTNKKYSEKENTIKKIPSGAKKVFEIYSEKCGNEVSKKILNLPVYNKFYAYKECNDIHEFNLCSKWATITKNISDEDLAKKTEEYKKKIDTSSEDVTKEYNGEIKGFFAYAALVILTLIINLFFAFYKKREKDFI